MWRAEPSRLSTGRGAALALPTPTPPGRGADSRQSLPGEAPPVLVQGVRHRVLGERRSVPVLDDERDDALPAVADGVTIPSG